jgi:hypothetical protein
MRTHTYSLARTHARTHARTLLHTSHTRYDAETKRILHVGANKCLDSMGDNLVVAVCADNRPEQQWTFSGHLNA